MNDEIILQHGLTLDEFKVIKEYLKRDLTIEELGIFSAMWNEHCCYKTSKKWLKKLPTSNEIVIQGPGENAGIIDVKDNDGIAFKIESHNHPSYIEPFNGAATGVGGILRDIFTMGARPIATLDSIRFGEISTDKTNYLLKSLKDVGCIKLDNFQRSNNKWGYAYLLTPKGLTEKADITLHFLKRKK